MTDISAEALRAAAEAIHAPHGENLVTCQGCAAARDAAYNALVAAARYLRAQGAELAADEWERHVYLPGRLHGARIGREVAARLREGGAS